MKIIWTLATTTAILSHFSVINREISYVYAAPLITAVRVLYAASIAWMILASAMGYGGIFAKILNFPIFVHVNKLSYAIYLLNPLLITVIYGAKDHSTHVEPLTMVSAYTEHLPMLISFHCHLHFSFDFSQVIMSVGVSVVCYLLSFVFSILFEMPYIRISGLLWRGGKTSAASTTASSSATKAESIVLDKIKKSL